MSLEAACNIQNQKPNFELGKELVGSSNGTQNIAVSYLICNENQNSRGEWKDKTKLCVKICYAFLSTKKNMAFLFTKKNMFICNEELRQIACSLAKAP